jgi:hypothetical protein
MLQLRVTGQWWGFRANLLGKQVKFESFGWIKTVYLGYSYEESAINHEGKEER